jgi:hypothetical protein
MAAVSNAEFLALVEMMFEVGGAWKVTLTKDGIPRKALAK